MFLPIIVWKLPTFTWKIIIVLSFCYSQRDPNENNNMFSDGRNYPYMEKKKKKKYWLPLSAQQHVYDTNVLFILVIPPTPTTPQD